ncbi:MAG: hypothetical protein ACI9FG_001331 [Crocinitomicaceae bacterium]|jgi:hypothetical protein
MLILLFTKSVRSFLGRAAFAVLAIALLCPVVGAAEKVYEKPSVFMKRQFGKLPKTQVLELSGAQAKQLKSIVGRSYPSKKIRYWQASGKTAWILEGIGKSQLITTGIVVKADKLTEIKVLVYRESHGWEVTRPFFTKQFVGASLNGKTLNKKIDGIVGATLSVNALKKLSAAALYLSQQTGK